MYRTYVVKEWVSYNKIECQIVQVDYELCIQLLLSLMILPSKIEEAAFSALEW